MKARRQRRTDRSRSAAILYRTVPIGTVLVAAATLMIAEPVGADGGEAGLVIQHGDESLETYCIAFEGGAIAGDDLLRAAGVPFEQVSGLVCTVGNIPGEGCPGASSLSSCTCRCKSGGDGCIYWSFFTKDYGEPWVYSASGFTAQRSGDGEMQAWRWGEGGPSFAPPPAEVTFEQVCGHSPRGSPPTSPPSRPSVTVTDAPSATPQVSPPIATPAVTPTGSSAPSDTEGPTTPTAEARSPTEATGASAGESASDTPHASGSAGPGLTNQPDGAAASPRSGPEQDGAGAGRSARVAAGAFAAVGLGLVVAGVLGITRRRRRDV